MEFVADRQTKAQFPAKPGFACKFCDYETVCGGKKTARRRAEAKFAATALPVLQAFREIHDED